MLTEEEDGFANGHIEYVVNILALEAHVQDVLLEPVSVTGFAFQNEVSHELHFDRDDASALAFIAASAVCIE